MSTEEITMDTNQSSSSDMKQPNSYLTKDEMLVLVVQPLFKRMKHLFGSKMDLNYSPNVLIEIQDLWAEELTAFTIGELRSTWSTIKQQQFPPSLSDMLSWLQPKYNYEQLFIEAARGEFYYKAVFEAAQLYGQYELRRDSYEKAKPRWKSLLDQSFKDYAKEIYIAPLKIEEKPFIKLDDQVVDGYRKQIHEILNRTKKPNKDWAYKLLGDYKNGEILCEAQIRSVSEALGIESSALRHSHRLAKTPSNEPAVASRKDRVLVD